MEQGVEISLPELVRLCAADTELFAKTFFPKAFRDESPIFARPVWELLEDPRHRHVLAELFRGAAKTTRTRVFAAKRVAYGLSRTILFVGASEDHAKRSVQWLRGNIEAKIGASGVAVPSFFAQTFGLRPGKKWQENEIEIYHGVDEKPIWVLGVGITGNVRGINFDDYRPDLIVLDDVITDENAATQEQRTKITDLILGAIQNSLAPASEEPNAKLVFLQTILDGNDAAAQAKKSPDWVHITAGCWTPETADLEIEQQESVWPTRYPTAALRKEKYDAIAKNKLSIFAREKECRLIGSEQSAFRPTWLRYYEHPPKGMQCVLAIDPVPPPSDKQLSKDLVGKDYEAISVVGRFQGEFYVLETAFNRGHDPNWTMAKAFELGLKWRVLRMVVETVAYQKVLKWILQTEMKRRQIYFAVKEAPNVGKSKFIRVSSALAPVASMGKLWVRAPDHAEFIQQFSSFGLGYKGHDDILESVAIAVAELTNPYLELGVEDYAEIENSPMEKFEYAGACP